MANNKKRFKNSRRKTTEKRPTNLPLKLPSTLALRENQLSACGAKHELAMNEQSNTQKLSRKGIEGERRKKSTWEWKDREAKRKDSSRWEACAASPAACRRCRPWSGSDARHSSREEKEHTERGFGTRRGEGFRSNAETEKTIARDEPLIIFCPIFGRDLPIWGWNPLDLRLLSLAQIPTR